MLSFTTPLALALLLTIPYFIWLGRPRATTRTPWRDWAALLVRLLIVALIVLGLAGAQAVRAADDLAVAFLLDASDSMSPAQVEQAEAFVAAEIARMGPNDQAAVVVFAADALVERPFSRLADLAPVTSLPRPLQTNLDEAMRLALAIFPAGSARRIVVLSDGIATAGDARGAAQLAATAGVPVDFVYLPRPAAGSEVVLLDVNAPTRVRQGEIFRIDITAESSSDTAAELRVLSGGALVHAETVQLRPGINSFTVRLQAGDAEFARYRVQLAPVADTFSQNNELSAYTEVTGAPRVLLVADAGGVDEAGNSVPDESQQLQLALEATGLDVERVTPDALPAGLAELSNYASVVLVNVNGAALAPRKMEALQSYVRDLGGGLVVVGGPQSYGMGGYFGTPLEAALPVEMQIQDEERLPAVSIVLVVDRSGSMSASEGGLTKIQLANEGAVRVVELLKQGDDITVIPVDTIADVPIGPFTLADKQMAIDEIRQIGAGGGGIYVRTGLEAAAAVLAGSTTPVKHIIVLADGGDAEEKEGVPQLLDALVAQGITVSTVSIGAGPDTPWLEQMAQLGNGRFHVTDQAANLPQIFTQETAAIQRNYLVEERFFPNLNSRSPILAGIQSVPPLYGYVATSPKDAAQVVLSTRLDDPLLATWQYGLGRAVAWTSDATGRWAREWVQWPGFAPFWTQAVRWTVSDVLDSQLETAVVYDDRQAQLVVDARDEDGRYLNGLELEANVVGPDGNAANLTLRQTAPGRYAADFTPVGEGAYLIRVAGDTPGGAALGQTAGWVLGYSPEYRDLVSSPRLLENVADVTNGRDLSSQSGAEAGVFVHDLPFQATARPIWPALLLVAVLLLPVDVALRRLVLTRTDLERAWMASFGRLRPQPATPQPRTEQVSRLFEAKERAGSRTATAPADSAPAPPPIERDAAVGRASAPQAAPPETQPAQPPSPQPPGETLAARLRRRRDDSEDAR